MAAGSKKQRALYIVHLVEPGAAGENVRPVCGEWGDSVSWATTPEAVSCPGCLAAEHLSEAGAGRSSAAPAPGRDSSGGTAVKQSRAQVV